MTTTTQPKASMHILKTSADPLVSQGARRATEETSGSAAPTTQPGADTEVVPRARRRQFSNADKRRILDAADRCTQPGEIGALLRREGVYWSSPSTWRRQREAADLAALAPQKRGPKPDPAAAEARQIAQLMRENERLKSQLDKAHLVIEVQKKLLPCWAVRSTTRTTSHDARRRRAAPTLGMAAACRAVGLWRGAPGRGAHTRAPRSPSRTAPLPRGTAPSAAGARTPRAEGTARGAQQRALLRHGAGGHPRHAARRGRYLGSVPHHDRALAADSGTRERRRQLTHPTYVKPELLATAPNQGLVLGHHQAQGACQWTCFHLYVILDIFSRQVVGWLIAERESANWPNS